MDLDQLLHVMTRQGASDLHLKPTRPPLVRLNGRLLPLKTDPLKIEGTAASDVHAEIEHLVHVINGRDQLAAPTNVLLATGLGRCMVFVSMRAQATEIATPADRGDAGHDRGEDQWHDHHLEQADEELTQPGEGGYDALATDQTDHHPRQHGNQDLPVELCKPW